MNGSSSQVLSQRLQNEASPQGPLLKRLSDLLLEAAGYLAGWAAGEVIDSFCDTELGVRLLFDVVEWPGRGLVEQCS